VDASDSDRVLGTRRLARLAAAGADDVNHGNASWPRREAWAKDVSRAAGEVPAPDLHASKAFGVLDDLRVPYSRGRASGPWHNVAARDAAVLHWHVSDGRGQPGQHLVWNILVWGRVAGDDTVAAFTKTLPGHYRRDAPVLDPEGTVRSWIWRSQDGGVILPFDPDELVANYRSEQYLSIGASPTASAEAVTRRAFYRLRPVIPRRVQLAARRMYTGIQERTTFPRWPIETALHDFTDRVMAILAEVAGAPIPHLAPWPHGHSWALVLTHDVESARGRDAIEHVRSREAALGLRSSWNFIPGRYAVSPELTARLRNAGCEIGVHGLHHDGRDLESLKTLKKRLPEIRRWAAAWNATGFRSPATHRVWEWMPLLGFDYDSSYPDTDRYEPMRGGCCSWLPYFNGDLVELPITMPQDHTLFEILRVDGSVWHEKGAFLKARGGMVLLDTHPDYLLKKPALAEYERLLSAFGHDETAWKALPGEVSGWWRRRAATSLRFVDGTWRPTGPAAGDARVAHVSPRASGAAGAGASTG
jgi:hypothetical protein